MNRKGFISNLLGLGGLAVFPKQWIQSYTKVYLLQSFVAGFQYYNGPSLISSLKEGDLIDLEREPNNPYDKFAIAVYYNKEKLGFIPAKENKMLSRLIDSEAIEIFAEITHVEAKASSWESISVAIYLLRLDNTPLPAHTNYLTQLKEPQYKSLKTQERVYKILYPGEYFSAN